MNEQRKAIIISTGMDNLPLLEKLKQSETLTGTSLSRLKTLYKQFSSEKLAIEKQTQDAIAALERKASDQRIAIYKAEEERRIRIGQANYQNTVKQRAASAAQRNANIAAGSVPENMKGHAGNVGGTVAAVAASGGTGRDILIGAGGAAAYGVGQKVAEKAAEHALGSGVVRETMVLVREFLRANYTKMLGSGTLLAQYLGFNFAKLASSVPIIGAGLAAGVGMKYEANKMDKAIGESDLSVAMGQKSDSILRKDLNKIISEAIKTGQLSSVRGGLLSGAMGDHAGIESVQRDLAKMHLKSIEQVREEAKAAEKSGKARAELQKKFAKFDEEEHAKWLKRQRERLENIQKELAELKSNRQEIAVEKIVQKRQEIEFYSGGNIPSLEAMSTYSGVHRQLEKQYGKGGVYDILRGSPYVGAAGDLDTLQHQYAWNVLHPGDPQNANMAGQRKRIDFITDAMNKAGIGPGAAFEKTNQHLENLNEKNAKILEALAVNGIVLKDDQ